MTTTENARTALERVNAPKEKKTILDLIERQKPAIEAALPRAVGGIERFSRIAMTEFARNPKLYECDPTSVLGSLMLSSQLGLELGPALGQAYLIPFSEKGGMVCQFVVGYKGYIELGYRSRLLSGLRTATVFEGDHFVYEEREGGPYMRHQECRPADRGAVVCYYVRAAITGGKPTIRRCWPEEIEKARLSSQLGRINKGPWHDHYEAQAWKTCVRRAASLWPQSAQFAQALAVDEQAARWESDGVEIIEQEAVSDDE